MYVLPNILFPYDIVHALRLPEQQIDDAAFNIRETILEDGGVGMLSVCPGMLESSAFQRSTIANSEAIAHWRRYDQSDRNTAACSKQRCHKTRFEQNG